MFSKALVCLLLVAVSIPVAISSASIQPDQTVTSTLTTPVTLATTSTSTTAALLYYVFNIPTQTGGCGDFNYYIINATSGSISGIISSNSTEVHFELASISEFNAWGLQPDGNYSGRDCIGPKNPIVLHYFNTTALYGFSANLPSNGQYVALFINAPADRAAHTSVSIFSTTISTANLTSFMLQTQTSTATSVQNPLTSIPGFPVESILLGCLVAFSILAMRRYRRATNA